jgi:PGF-pre-PGF domain-containing protein
MQDKTFEWLVSCRNLGNIQGNSSIRTLTVDAISEPVGSAEKPPGKEGKGITSQPSPGIAEKTITQEIQLLASGNAYSYKVLSPGLNIIDIQDKSLSLESLEIFSSVLMNNVEIKVEELNKIPEKYKNINRLENVHKYIYVETDNLLDALVSSRKFTFKLSKSLSADKEVNLYVYDEIKDDWIKLYTKKLREEGNFVYYQSESPHLSLFAIKIESKLERKEIKQTIPLKEVPLGSSLSQITEKEEFTRNEYIAYISILVFTVLLFSSLLILGTRAIIKRLMKRTSELSWLYYSKSIFLTPKGCSSNLELELSSYANKTFSINSSFNLRDVYTISQNIRRKNNDLSCKLF